MPVLTPNDPPQTMATHSFTLVLEKARKIGEEDFDKIIDRLYVSGCDGAVFAERDGLLYADFDREGPTFADAVLSAVDTIEVVAPEVRVLRLQPDDLVSAASIAHRLGRSRESISQLIKGERGPADFPRPALHVAGKRPFWRWSEVARWFEEYQGKPPAEDGSSEFTAALNALLDLRTVSGRLNPSARQKLLAWTVDHVTPALQQDHA